MATPLVKIMSQALKDIDPKKIGSITKNIDGTSRSTVATADDLIERLSGDQVKDLEKRISEILKTSGEKDATAYMRNFFEKTLAEELYPDARSRTLVGKFRDFGKREEGASAFRNILDDASVYTEEIRQGQMNYFLNRTADIFEREYKPSIFRRSPGREEIEAAVRRSYGDMSLDEVRNLSNDQIFKDVTRELFGESLNPRGRARRITKPQDVHEYKAREFDDFADNIESMMKSGNIDRDILHKRMSKVAGEERAREALELFDQGNIEGAMKEIRMNRSNYMENVSMKDHLLYHKVPQKSAVVVGGAWLVSNMSSRRGQLTNAELYGQQTPYY